MRNVSVKHVVILIVGLASLFIGTLLSAQSGEFPLTDFNIRSVELSEIMSGGPPRDGIPPIDSPQFVSIESARTWLKPDEPVVVFEQADDARAYPLQILIFHEIVNDVVGELPVSVTFCPLCNASIVFDRTVEGDLLDFGTTGRLRNSDLIMYDRQSESWWQQFTGKGIIGKYTDIALGQLDSQIVSFDTFSSAYPEGKVLSRDTGFKRAYGTNPYSGYDSVNSSPFLYRGKLDPRLPPMERVLSIPNGVAHLLVPLSSLDTTPVFNTSIGGSTVVVIASSTANSALDKANIAESRKIPAAAAFLAYADKQSLTFEFRNSQIIDIETRSIWNPLGIATSGTLKGNRLEQIDKGVHFAFAWLAFDPEAGILKP